MMVLILLSLAASCPARACDVCGCSLGGNYFGILPLYNKNFVGLRWSQAKFHSYIAPTQYLSAQQSNDTYAKVELWGRYYLTKRIQLFAFVPYAYNNMNGTDQAVSASGLGDISIMANYVVVNTGESKSDFKHTLIAGGGVKLPTGKFDLEDKGKIINRNFQLGTGSVDFNVNAVYTLRYKKTGINVETGYKINTRNSHEYLFGNQYRASAQLFYWQTAGAFSFLPHAGMNYEQAAMHKDGDIIQVNTGGSAWLGSGGVDIYINRFTLGVNYQKPVSQHYNSDATADITSKARWTTSLTFNF
ncbi:hypothetical protein JI741_05580 [Chryseolinea sp. Jin1]|uniref:Transporter n=2 Tax=Chryseolinea lacunae TaxID=2801331 RepID=A0ABS1KPQ4_9BACT|nr:hypothetical protein [Chryseolinea lacunae]